MDKITPHMYSAVALLLIAIALTYAGILSSTAEVEISNEEFKRRAEQVNMELVQSQQVMSALGKEPKRLYQNPFLEPLARENVDTSAIIDIKVPKPPAPIMRLPMPPVLPLPGEQ